MTLYVVTRQTQDGDEADIFTDRALAEKWAYRVNERMEEIETIDADTLAAMEEAYAEQFGQDDDEEPAP